MSLSAIQQVKIRAALEATNAHASAIEGAIVPVRERLPNSVCYRDLSRGLQTFSQYIIANTPELLEGGLRVLDVGPGVGCFMALARALGNVTFGIDTTDAAPHSFAAAYRSITQAWGLNVLYVGFPTSLVTAELLQEHKCGYDMIHFRGSLDGVLAPFKGAPLGVAVHDVVTILHSFLVKNGFIWISHNNDAELPRILPELRASAIDVGFKITVDQETSTRLRKL